jgi:ferredoxin
MKIIIDEKKCVGCGRCTEICPANFKLSVEGKAQVQGDKVEDCAKKAADECPQEAIHVEL